MMFDLLCFPGQGSQYPGMAKDWFENFQEAKLCFEEGSEGSKLDLKKIVFDGTDSDLRPTEVTQPAILTASVAIFRCIQKQFGGFTGEKIFAGHSLGEYTALVAAESLSLLDAAALVRVRGRLMQEAVAPGQGSMAAIVFKPGSESVVLATKLCQEATKNTGGTVDVANFNSPEQIVVSGHRRAIDWIVKNGSQAEFGARKVVELSVSAPFHSSLMNPAAEGLKAVLAKVSWVGSKLRYIANVDAQIHSLSETKMIPERLVSQVASSVRWVESVQAAISAGATRSVEIGPQKVLSGLNRRISSKDVVLETVNIDRLEEYKNAALKL